MKYKNFFTLFLVLCMVIPSLQNVAQAQINKQDADKVIQKMVSKYGEQSKFRITRGVNQTAGLWKGEDGDAQEFEQFCTENYIDSKEKLDKLFERLQENFEVLYGHYNKVVLDLNRPLHLDCGEMTPVDLIFGAYSPNAHLQDDFYKNKVAFVITLNFPFYSLKEKEELGKMWTPKEWAYARIGDMFISRIPAHISQGVSDAMTKSGNYIAEYNIWMGSLVDDDMETQFPKDMKLLTHWNLRDEIKAQYAKEDGLKKQKMIYNVMTKIVTQEIPEVMINKNDYQWNPVENLVYKNGKEVEFKTEPNTRYQFLLDNYKAYKAIDRYNPQYPTYIKAKFEGEFELPQEKVEKLFVDLVSSPTVKKVAKLIEERLGRDLEPFDIWYDGFKSRSSINQDELNAITTKLYPNTVALEKDIPNILVKLNFTKAQADFIGSKIAVDAARGSGHAWGAEMRTEKARLRTRIAKTGMDYKGYNIAIHELGHNVEQTITLQNVPYYALRGVPNTAFTEAWAFMFQKRDLMLLGKKDENPNKEHLMALDNFWSSYEIMGVSLVDMQVWKWLYDNPNASAEDLKQAVLRISKEVWNKYYAEVFGVKDQVILGVYSHMIENPLYLSAYPIGHLIEFQMDEYIGNKPVGPEMQRMLIQGRVTPDKWMKEAVGAELSVQPSINATNKAIEAMEK